MSPLAQLFTQRPAVPAHLTPAQLEEKLLHSAERVFSEWALLTPRRVGVASDRPAGDRLHAVVDLEGPRQGQLSVSCQERFGGMLAVAATGDGHAASFAREAVLELTQLLRETLLVQGLDQDGRDYLLQAARLAETGELPTEAPLAAVTLKVNGYPIDLRLWLRRG